jgi:hypothetical protein
VGTYNLPNDTVDLIEHVVRTNDGQAATQADLSVARISVSTYASLPNKLATGRPIQVYIDRMLGEGPPAEHAGHVPCYRRSSSP